MDGSDLASVLDAAPKNADVKIIKTDKIDFSELSAQGFKAIGEIKIIRLVNIPQGFCEMLFSKSNNILISLKTIVVGDKINRSFIDNLCYFLNRDKFIYNLDGNKFNFETMYYEISIFNGRQSVADYFSGMPIFSTTQARINYIRSIVK